jgi:hypothetical protein
MDQQQATVAELFLRAQALHQENPNLSYKQIKEALVKEFSRGPLPSLELLAIPEQDDRAPEEDWSAGLPLVRRGIQFNDWNEIANGIILSLEQTERYEQERGPEGDRDDWHDRMKGIDDAVAKGVDKWMPSELVELAERSVKK